MGALGRWNSIDGPITEIVSRFTTGAKDADMFAGVLAEQSLHFRVGPGVHRRRERRVRLP